MSQNLRVLIVEDEYLVASYLTDLVEEAGHEVIAAVETGESAQERLMDGGIDLAILDIKLQGILTGIDVARIARARLIPHVFVSGSGDPTTRTAAEATGPVAFIQKPLDQRQLDAVFTKLLREAVNPQESSSLASR
ncbi:response regulator [Methylobacterium durans]|uniref:response regulator n=1 Tax=Methylobacterium durans TaxID=2202825 RepID=UPI0013A560A7|nr:response regulator [Methylobacterium durans]